MSLRHVTHGTVSTCRNYVGSHAYIFFVFCPFPFCIFPHAYSTLRPPTNITMMKISLAILAAPTLLSKTVKSMSTTATERTFTCSDGVKLVAKCWRNNVDNLHHHQPTKKILCLHGWLDNAASFNRLAPLLLLDSKSSLSEEQQQPMEIVALDFPGHGLSHHKSVDGPPQLLAEVRY